MIQVLDASLSIEASFWQSLIQEPHLRAKNSEICSKLADPKQNSLEWLSHALSNSWRNTIYSAFSDSMLITHDKAGLNIMHTSIKAMFSVTNDQPPPFVLEPAQPIIMINFFTAMSVPASFRRP